jgi:phage replication-related protein YjqB (UPF0714/DUF867 family)
MGRGKQRAKHAKIAREIKYQRIQTDFAALEQELAGADGANGGDADADFTGADTDPLDDRPRTS